MRNIKICVLVLLTLFSRQGFSCDACSMYEFSPLQAKSFVGVFYNYSFFNGYKDLGQLPRFTFDANSLRASNLHVGDVDGGEDRVNPTSRDYEMYQTIDVRFNYNYNNKWNFFINLPLESNSVYFDEVISNSTIGNQLYTETGIGDVLLVGEKISILDKESAKHVFKYGLGLFIPSGKLDLINDEGNLNHITHYPGRGNFESMLRFSYSTKLKEKYGAMVLSTFTLGTSSKSGEYTYVFGPRVNIQSNVFYDLQIADEIKLIPMVGLYYEEISAHKLNGKSVSGTEAKAILANVSTGFKLKSCLLRVEYQLSLWQKEVALQLQNAGRLNLMLIYNL